ncbi:Transcriptional regulator, LysR family [Candidatus Burkholderia verschuerenii]|uniref:Transcriptional regulator, LysR family n=1 Tax=Candidatus Burkholderia verschuerenii TaxID=242163 RepID=A0A0L0M3Z3_9BURK|nr:Transcriptional regulator, LysR family [Candidatus Burkholderia verschuerenii]
MDMLKEDKLSGVATFIKVVEAGSFALAAERLDLTRSAVGKSIARLETRLGVRLLHRTTRSQALTDEGQGYYERCLRALAELEAAEADLEAGRLEPRGRLRVSVPLALGHFCVPPVLFDLARRHPQLQIDISFGDRRVDLIEEGFDLAVRIGALPDSPTLVARRLGMQHVSFGASPAYLEEHGTPRTLDDLEAHRGIGLSVAGTVVSWDVTEPDGRPRRVPLRPQLSMDDIQAVAGAVIDGHGIAWLPCWLLARYVRSGHLVAVLPAHRIASRRCRCSPCGRRHGICARAHA